MLLNQLENLYDEEIKVLFENFDYYFWPKWYKDLRKKVILALGYSPYSKQEDDPDFPEYNYHDSEDELEEIHSKVCLRVKKALNRNKKS